MVKKLTFCKLLYHRKCKWRGVGGQKKPNLVNVVCERPLTAQEKFPTNFQPNKKIVDQTVVQNQKDEIRTFFCNICHSLGKYSSQELM